VSRQSWIESITVSRCCQAVGRGRVDVDPRLLVGDLVRELAPAERDVLERQPLDQGAVALVEAKRLVVAPGHERPVPDQLAHGLVDGGLRQVRAGDALLPGPDGRGLQSHRVRELGADDAEQPEHEHDGEQREPALRA
jgi:hypothetical protein